MSYVSIGAPSVSGRRVSVFALGVGGVVLVASFVTGWWQRVAAGGWSLYADVRQHSPYTWGCWASRGFHGNQTTTYYIVIAAYVHDH